MSEKWTKGPWHFEADQEDDVVYVCHPGTNSPDTTVCMFEVDGHEVIANAHLIAAAPDMYEMLMHIKDKILYPMSHMGGDIAMFGESFGIATNELLKKARGES